MIDLYKGHIPILDDTAPCRESLFSHKFARGYEERDYKLYPQEMFDHPDEMDLDKESTWDALFDEQEERQNSLEHIYLAGGQPAFVNLDQNGHGYCWAYSTGHATMMDRLARNMPPIRLNPHSVAAIIKGGRDEGGWCGLSAEKLREIGIAPEGNGPGEWPLHSLNLRNDTPELRKNMARFKTLESWVDLTKQVYDQQLTREQVATCGLRNVPTAQDFNWWGHSVCGIRWVRIERGSWGPLILNSWKGWGRFGLAVLRGSQATCNGAVAIRSTTAKVG